MRALTIYQPQAYLAGVLHGDGWCTDLSLGLRCKDFDFSTAFAAALNDACGTQVTPRRDERGYWLIRQGNKSGKFSHLRGVEPENSAEVSAWLRGLFDSEGNAQCISLPRKGPNSFQRRIAFYSTSTDTLLRAHSYLNLLGLDSVIREQTASATHKGTKPVFELKLVRRPSLQAFSTAVGSSISRKQETLLRIASTFQPEGWQAENWKRAISARYPERIVQ